MNYFLYPSAPGCWLSSFFICLWYHFVSASWCHLKPRKSVAKQIVIYEALIRHVLRVSAERDISLCYSTMLSQQYTWISNKTQDCCLWKIFAIWKTIGGIAVIPRTMLLHYIFLSFFLSSVLLTYFFFLFARFEIHPTPQPPTLSTSSSVALRACSLFAYHDLKRHGQHFVETQAGI